LPLQCGALAVYTRRILMRIKKTETYVALLRGINVGGERRVEMKKLKAVLEALGYKNISTYINSGNIIFESADKIDAVHRDIEKILKKEFGFEIPALIKTGKDMKKIAEAIPASWQNDEAYKTDVAYLFGKIDSKRILDELPVNKTFIDVRYVSGAVFWNINRKNYNKSRINKLIGHELYQFMTVRNVNTARFLANSKE